MIGKDGDTLRSLMDTSGCFIEVHVMLLSSLLLAVIIVPFAYLTSTTHSRQFYTQAVSLLSQ